MLFIVVWVGCIVPVVFALLLGLVLCLCRVRVPVPLLVVHLGGLVVLPWCTTIPPLFGLSLVVPRWRRVCIGCIALGRSPWWLLLLVVVV